MVSVYSSARAGPEATAKKAMTSNPRINVFIRESLPISRALSITAGLTLRQFTSDSTIPFRSRRLMLHNVGDHCKGSAYILEHLNLPVRKQEGSMYLRKVHGLMLAALLACPWFFSGVSDAQGVPTGDQLNQLVAPIALYPDALLAQICAASGDPQQIIDADNWLKQNGNLTGPALTDAAQQQGFDPAFISLVTLPSVLDAMAKNIDDYAAIGAAFKANQASVMSAIQTLRQQAYASGALDSNDYQNVSVEQQDGAQVVVVQ